GEGDDALRIGQPGPAGIRPGRGRPRRHTADPAAPGVQQRGALLHRLAPGAAAGAHRVRGAAAAASAGGGGSGPGRAVAVRVHPRLGAAAGDGALRRVTHAAAPGRMVRRAHRLVPGAVHATASTIMLAPGRANLARGYVGRWPAAAGRRGTVRASRWGRNAGLAAAAAAAAALTVAGCSSDVGGDAGVAATSPVTSAASPGTEESGAPAPAPESAAPGG